MLMIPKLCRILNQVFGRSTRRGSWKVRLFSFHQWKWETCTEIQFFYTVRLLTNSNPNDVHINILPGRHQNAIHQTAAPTNVVGNHDTTGYSLMSWVPSASVVVLTLSPVLVIAVLFMIWLCLSKYRANPEVKTPKVRVFNCNTKRIDTNILGRDMTGLGERNVFVSVVYTHT